MTRPHPRPHRRPNWDAAATTPLEEPTVEFRCVPASDAKNDADSADNASAASDAEQTDAISTSEISNARLRSLPDPRTDAPGEGARRADRLTGVAGVLAVMLVLLGAGMLVAKVASLSIGMPGPYAGELTAQILGAGLAVPGYLLVARGHGPVRVAAAAGLVVLLLALMWFFWWY